MKYGLIGGRLAHSYSAEIHAKIGGYPYELKELAPNELNAFFVPPAFEGINVTIPYKQSVIPYLTDLSPEAAAIGAVNTIVNRGGSLYGYNTDFEGMRALIERAGICVFQKKVLVLGTGGTSRTAVAVAKSLGAGEVLRVSRTAKEGAISYTAAARDHADAEILINTTPVGMYPETGGVPVDLAAFPRLCGVVDAIYHPLRTGLVLDAEARGIPATGGLYMLVRQAVAAAELFFDQPQPPEKTERIYRELLAEKRNIVLTGMPGAGKTTVGKCLAEKLSKPFFDADEEVLARIGVPIATFFATHGEAAFREEETAVIHALAGQSGAVIATGGGAILKEENVRELKKNGVLVFLDRDPAEIIPTPDRPLAAGRAALERLYEVRYPRYLATADRRVSVANGDVAAVTNTVWEAAKG